MPAGITAEAWLTHSGWVLELLRVAAVAMGWLFFALCAGVAILVLMVLHAGNREKVAKGGARNDLRVLVADDSFLFRGMVHKILTERGIEEIDTAGDGRDAMELAKAAAHCGRPYRLMLIDWNMPKASGLEVIMRLRNEAAHDKMVILMISAMAEPGAILEAKRAGATGYITKPVAPEKLQERLNEAVGLIEKGYFYKRA